MPDDSLRVERDEPRMVLGAHSLAMRRDRLRAPGGGHELAQRLGIRARRGHEPMRHAQRGRSPIWPAMFSNARMRSPIGGWVSHRVFARSSNDLIGLTM